jgi:integrase
MQKKLTDKLLQNLKAPSSGRLEIWDTLLPGFGLRVTENDARTYFVMYRTGFGANRKQRRYKIGDAKVMTLGEAREAARKALGKVEKGVDPAAERVPVQGIQVAPDSFAAAAEAYLAKHVKKNTRASTCRETKRIFDVDLIPAWGPRPVASITRRDVVAVLDTITGRGAEVQANRTLARLRTFFNWASDEEYIAASPVTRMKPPTKEETRDRVLSDDEIRAFWQATGELGWPFGPLFRLLLVTAQRRDEVAGMAWSELDFTRRVWTIPKERAKNSQAHDVALSQLALELIAELLEVDGTLVFTTTHDRTEAAPTSVSGFSRGKDRLDVILTGYLKASAVAKPLRASEMRGNANITAKDHGPFSEHDIGRVIGLRHGDRWGYVRITEVATAKQAKARILVPPFSTEPADAYLLGPDPWILHDLRRSATTCMAGLGVPPHVVDRLLNHVAGQIRGVAAVYNRHQYTGERAAALEMWGTYIEGLIRPAPAANVVQLARQA